jgi:regulatory protein
MPARPDAYLAGLRLLGRRELSSAQLRERLARRGFAAAEIEAALGRLGREGALDDRRAARAYAVTAARVKGRGRLRILRELHQMGIDPALAREAVDAAFAEVDEARLLERALDKRLGRGVPSDADYRRAARALARLGFAPEAIAAALGRRRHGSDAEPA